jgi:ribosomal protein L16 Arg81 hydroxylase
MPHSQSDALQLVEQGYTLLVRHAERHDPRLAHLAAEFQAAFAAPVNIHMYCTPGGQYGFGWHYDAEEVFILQTRGTKEYFLRRNTMNPNPVPEPHYDFSAISRERTPVMACTLVAGDWLYIPSGWWHAATAREDSLSISVGVLGVHA